MFPIGHLMKHEVREIAQMRNFLMRVERQPRHLLLGKINYNDFVRRFLREKEGAVVEWETGNGSNSPGILVSHYQSA